MGYKCSFIDNEVYGADDVSEAFSKIISGGVVVECDSENVIGSLNSLTGEIITAGTRSYEDLTVTMADGVIKINKGTGFFESGVSVTVDDEGVLLDKGDMTEGYVSFLYDADFNRVLPQLTLSEPRGDVLVLASFDTNTVSDRRSYAHSKLSINSANVYHDFTINMSGFSNFGNAYQGSIATYKMPHNDFKYLLLRSAYCPDLKLELNDTVIDLNKEGTQKFSLIKSSPRAELWVDRQGDTLTFTAYYAYMSYPQTYEFTLA